MRNERKKGASCSESEMERIKIVLKWKFPSCWQLPFIFSAEAMRVEWTRRLRVLCTLSCYRSNVGWMRLTAKIKLCALHTPNTHTQIFSHSPVYVLNYFVYIQFLNVHVFVRHVYPRQRKFSSLLNIINVKRKSIEEGRGSTIFIFIFYKLILCSSISTPAMPTTFLRWVNKKMCIIFLRGWGRKKFIELHSVLSQQSLV